MRKTLIGIVVGTILLFLTGNLVAQEVKVTVPNGTPIKLLLDENVQLQSENTHPGDSVAFRVAEDVDIDGITVIRQGALAYGLIGEGTEWARRLGRGAWIFLELRNVTDVTGRVIPVREPREGMGSNRPGKDHKARYMQARGRGTEIALSLNPFIDRKSVV